MKMSVKFFLLFSMAGIYLYIGLTGCRGERSNENEVAREDLMAEVGNEAITRQDLEAALKRIPRRKQEEIKEKVLDDLIENRVFSREAARVGLDEDPEVKKALAKAEKETLARYFVQKYLDKEANPTEEQLQTFYREHKDQFVRSDKRKIPFEEARSRIYSRMFWEKKKEIIRKYYQEAKVNTHPPEEGALVGIGDEIIPEEILTPILAKVPEEKQGKARSRWIEYFIETHVFSKEAKKVHLENDPEVATELRRKKDQILANFFRRQCITGRFNINEQEIDDYYQTHLEEFRKPLRVRAKSILVKTRQEAAEILKEVKEGAPFARMAVKKSLYAGASDRAGEIGWFGRGERDPALEKVAFSLERGQISDIIETEAGYEIIKLMDKKGGEVMPLDEMKQTIKMTLVRQRFEEEKQRYYKKAEVTFFGI